MDTAATPNLGPEGAQTPAEMEITEQVSTYRAFNGMAKWGSLAIAALVLFLVLCFCTPAGFWPAAIVSLLLVAVGIFALRKKVAADPVHSPA